MAEGIDEAALRKEQAHIGRRLAEIRRLLGEDAPMSQNPPTVRVSLARFDHMELQRIANRASTSPAALAEHAIRQLIQSARAGALPFVAPAKLETAEAVGAMGRPLV